MTPTVQTEIRVQSETEAKEYFLNLTHFFKKKQTFSEKTFAPTCSSIGAAVARNASLISMRTSADSRFQKPASVLYVNGYLGEIVSFLVLLIRQCWVTF